MELFYKKKALFQTEQGLFYLFLILSQRIFNTESES